MEKKIFAVIFCVIIILGFILLIRSNINNIKTDIKIFTKNINVERLYKQIDTYKFGNRVDKVLKNGYMILQRLQLKHEIGNFAYYLRDDNGAMVITKEKSVAKENLYDTLLNLKPYLDENSIPFLYVVVPEEVKEKNLLLLKNIDYSNQIADTVVKKISEELPVLDLRKVQEISELPSNFYKTDHHLNMETTFLAVRETILELNKLYGQQFDKNNIYTNKDEYSIHTVKESFYGSKRLNIGEVYLKREDFVYYLPKFDTDLEFVKYKNKEKEIEKTGEFQETLLDNQILYDKNYINKYNAFLYGGKEENIIINNKAESDKKLLLISSSYGRSFSPYISMNFKETRYIDPQEGRFEKDVLEYIEVYKPDVIIVLYKAGSK